MTQSKTYRRPPLEDNRLMAGTFAVGESADRLGSLVLEAREQLVELLDAESLEEPFPTRPMRFSSGAFPFQKKGGKGIGLVVDS